MTRGWVLLAFSETLVDLGGFGPRNLAAADSCQARHFKLRRRQCFFFFALERQEVVNVFFFFFFAVV